MTTFGVGRRRLAVKGYVETCERMLEVVVKLHEELERRSIDPKDVKLVDGLRLPCRRRAGRDVDDVAGEEDVRLAELRDVGVRRVVPNVVEVLVAERLGDARGVLALRHRVVLAGEEDVVRAPDVPDVCVGEAVHARGPVGAQLSLAVDVVEDGVGDSIRTPRKGVTGLRVDQLHANPVRRRRDRLRSEHVFVGLVERQGDSAAIDAVEVEQPPKLAQEIRRSARSGESVARAVHVLHA
jgi:hypothetical protein